MRFRLFQYPLPTDPDLPDLNAFLAGRRVAAVAHHVTPHAGGSLLVFVVETVGGASTEMSSPAAPSPKVDYRELLSEDEFAIFSRLRTERRQIAEAEGIPVYTVFTNAQLAEMVRRRVTTAASSGMDPFGSRRIDRFPSGTRRRGRFTPRRFATASRTTR